MGRIDLQSVQDNYSGGRKIGSTNNTSRQSQPTPPQPLPAIPKPTVVPIVSNIQPALAQPISRPPPQPLPPVTVTIPAPITTTCSLVGLDTQFREIQDWVQAKRKQTLLPDAEKDKKFRHCIAISGPPGTGKSALVDQVITSMQFKSVCKFTVGSTISISLAEELKAALIRQPLQAILNPTVGSSLHNHARDTAIVIEELDAIVEIGSRASKVNVDDPSDPLILGKLIDVLNKIPSHQTPPIFITYQDMTSQKHKPYKTFIGTKCKKVDLKPYTEATLERIGREVTKKHGWSNIIPSVFLKQMAQMANGDARKMISVVQELGYFHTAQVAKRGEDGSEAMRDLNVIEQSKVDKVMSTHGNNFKVVDRLLYGHGHFTKPKLDSKPVAHDGHKFGLPRVESIESTSSVERQRYLETNPDFVQQLLHENYIGAATRQVHDDDVQLFLACQVAESYSDADFMDSQFIGGSSASYEVKSYASSLYSNAFSTHLNHLVKDGQRIKFNDAPFGSIKYDTLRHKSVVLANKKAVNALIDKLSSSDVSQQFTHDHLDFITDICMEYMKTVKNGNDPTEQSKFNTLVKWIEEGLFDEADVHLLVQLRYGADIQRLKQEMNGIVITDEKGNISEYKIRQAMKLTKKKKAPATTTTGKKRSATATSGSTAKKLKAADGSAVECGRPLDSIESAAVECGQPFESKDSAAVEVGPVESESDTSTVDESVATKKPKKATTTKAKTAKSKETATSTETSKPKTKKASTTRKPKAATEETTGGVVKLSGAMKKPLGPSKQLSIAQFATNVEKSKT